MHLRLAVPLSLLALLASAGCVSVGSEAPAPARGTVPPVGVPDAPPPAPSSSPLPLGSLPVPVSDPDTDTDPAAGGAADPGPDPDPDSEVGPPAAVRPPGTARRSPPRHAEKPKTPPRRVRSPKPPAARPQRHPALPPRMDELCAAAEGTVPPSIVDLCLRQYGR